MPVSHARHKDRGSSLLRAASILFLALAVIVGGTMITNSMASARLAREAADRDAMVAARYSRQEKARELAAAHAYNRRLAAGATGGRVQIDGGYEGSPDYKAQLHAPGNVMATLRIPKIGLAQAIYHGATMPILAAGLGHLPDTSLPVGGPSTRAVIVGHRGLPDKPLFTRLPEVKVGNMFFITVLGRTMAYKVVQEKTILPDQVGSLRIVPGRDLVTLVTCTPLGVNTHRLLVTGTRVPWHGPARQESLWDRLRFWLPLAAVVIFYLAVKVMQAVRKRRHKASHKA